MLTLHTSPSSNTAPQQWAPPPTEKKNILTVEVLHDPAWIDSVFDLHEHVRGQTPYDQPPVLIFKNENYFLDLLSGKTGILLGGFIGGELAGLTAVRVSPTFTHAASSGTISLPQAEEKLGHVFTNGPVAILQSVCVLPQHKKNGLSKKILVKALDQASHLGCTDVFAQVAAHNAASLGMFKKSGFASIVAWHSDYVRVLLHKTI